MNKLITKIFNSYNYKEVSNIGRTYISFYKHEKLEIANYFIVYTIDCRKFEDDEVQVIKALEQLEEDYATKSDEVDYTLKQCLINSFNNINFLFLIGKTHPSDNIRAVFMQKFI